jgi:OmpA-OmpF porin, OOP family
MIKNYYTPLRSHRMSILKSFFIGTIACLLSIDANAQSSDRRWNLGASIGTTEYAGDLGNGFADFNKTTLSKNTLYGVSITRYLSRIFDFTLSGTYSTWGYYRVDPFKGNLTTGVAAFKLKLNNGILINEDSRIGPYFLLGAGFARFSESSSGKSSEGVSYPAVGGAGLNLRITKLVGLNYQMLYGYMTEDKHDNKAGASLNDAFMFHSIGVNFNLGKTDPDSDMDGVSDKKDKCPETPPGVKTDAFGCPFDSDKDGVMDYAPEFPEHQKQKAARMPIKMA